MKRSENRTLKEMGINPLKDLNSSISIIGADEEVAELHLTAYKAEGIPVRGIFDRDLEKAERLAQRFGISKVYQSFHELLNDEVAVIDLSIPGLEILDYTKQLAGKGKHILINDLHSEELTFVKQIFNISIESNIKISFNSQKSLTPLNTIMEKIINEEFSEGNILNGFFRISSKTSTQETLENNHISVNLLSNYMNLFRSIFGNPVRVYAIKSTSVIHLVIEFENGNLISSLLEYMPLKEIFNLYFRINGSERTLTGNFGPHDGNYQTQTSSGIDLKKKEFKEIIEVGIPQQYCGQNLKDLLKWIHTGVEPGMSSENYYKTYCFSMAIRKSIRERRPVLMSELDFE